MKAKTGFSTTTYRKQLYPRHLEWMEETKNLYNKVLEFYYQLLFRQMELLSLSDYELLRSLEILTIGTREHKKAGILPELPLDGFPKLPLYFRRAAINAAIGMIRSYASRLADWQKNLECSGQPAGCPQPAAQFHAAPVFYQGMYRNWEEDAIELKLWTGSCWKWTFCRMKGRALPKEGKCLSPSLKVLHKRAELHIPVEQKVADIRKIRERLQTGDSICAVYLPNQDTLAVCVHMNPDGTILHTSFFKGGSELKRQKEALLLRATRNPEEKPVLSYRVKRKLQQMNEACAHQISRQIVDFAVQRQVTVIAVPGYRTAMPPSILQKSGSDIYTWIGRSILKKISYKAFQKGILVGTVAPKKLAFLCAECGAEVMRYNEGHRPGYAYYGGKLFLCPNGHQGNAARNAAVNVGKVFLEQNRYRTLPQEN